VETRAERLSGAPAIGAEIGTIPPVLVPSDFGHNPELASDGAGFLSVQEVSERIRAVRVDDAGHVLDADWLDLGTDDGSLQLYPAAAFAQGTFQGTASPTADPANAPPMVGDKPLTQAQLENLWITDRERLLTCIRRHIALRDFYADRDTALEGGKK